MEYFVWSVDPVAISFGSVRVFWYGILFATAILSGFEIIKYAYKKEGKSDKSLDSLFMYTVVGVVIGARLGHCFFYDPVFYLSHPLKIFAIWEGGLASHGGGLGLIISLWFYVTKYKVNFLWLLDRAAIGTALFGFFVRMGNFMNSEIIGIKTEVPWAIVFSRIDELPRHPVQLYEAFVYLSIFFVLISIYMKNYKTIKSGLIFGIFLFLVFSARFLLEFVKVKQASYTSEFFMSTGQILSLPFLLVGIFLIFRSLKK